MIQQELQTCYIYCTINQTVSWRHLHWETEIIGFCSQQWFMESQEGWLCINQLALCNHHVTRSSAFDLFWSECVGPNPRKSQDTPLRLPPQTAFGCGFGPNTSTWLFDGIAALRPTILFRWFGEDPIPFFATPEPTSNFQDITCHGHRATMWSWSAMCCCYAEKATRALGWVNGGDRPPWMHLLESQSYLILRGVWKERYETMVVSDHVVSNFPREAK